MPKYNGEYPELNDWDDYTYGMQHFGKHFMCFPYSSYQPMPFMMQTSEGPVFVRYARNGSRPVMNCYPNLCYPIYITHK
jgi:hypothetical protein